MFLIGYVMKSVMIAVSSLNSGGAERVSSLLANYMSSRYRVYVLVTHIGSVSSFYKFNDNVEIIYLSKYLVSNLPFRKIFAIRKLINELQPDLLLSFLTNVNINMILATFFLNIRTIICERARYDFISRWSILNILRVLLYPFADKIIVQTNENKERLLQNTLYINKDKVDVIHNSFDPELHKYHKNNFELSKRVVSFGRFSKEKQFTHIIDAFRMSFDSSWRLDLYGGGMLKRDLIEYSKNFDNVHINDSVKNVYEIMSRSDIFVFASNSEGFPNVLLEALAIGVPSVSYDCADGPREMYNGDNFALVPLGNIKLLSSEMHSLATNITKRQNMSKASTEYIKANFDEEVVMSKWLRVFNF